MAWPSMLKCTKCKGFREVDSCGLKKEIKTRIGPELFHFETPDWNKEIGQRLPYDECEPCPYFEEEIANETESN